MCGKLSQKLKCIKNVKHNKINIKLEANVDTKVMLIAFTRDKCRPVHGMFAICVCVCVCVSL